MRYTCQSGMLFCFTPPVTVLSFYVHAFTCQVPAYARNRSCKVWGHGRKSHRYAPRHIPTGITQIVRDEGMMTRMHQFHSSMAAGIASTASYKYVYSLYLPIHIADEAVKGSRAIRGSLIHTRMFQNFRKYLTYLHFQDACRVIRCEIVNSL